MKYAQPTNPIPPSRKFTGKKKSPSRRANRKKFKRRKKLSAYVGSNIERPWWGNEGMTPNLWRREE